MTPRVQPFIVATAGHVDHGKSSLVKALTGIDPDRLPEERARGMTIDLGFAHLDLASLSSQGEPLVYRLGIVDVPGHEDFVKNMVAGVGSVDLALLAVAADDGWMPQTEEHLQILSYLGVERGVIAITKADRTENLAGVAAAIRGHLAGTPLREAPLVATSVVNGTGLDGLRFALLSELDRTVAPVDIGKPRLPVDRAFSLAGVGTVVTGTLSGGSLEAGQEVTVQPAGLRTRVRMIQSHGTTVNRAIPGMRVALNLAGTRPGKGHGTAHHASTETAVARGDVVMRGGAPGDTLDVSLSRYGGDGRKSPGEATLRNALRVYVHHGSGAVAGRMYLLNPEDVTEKPAIAQLRLDQPICASGGDRLVLRSWSGRTTLAGGTVLDPHPSRRNWRHPERRRLLEARAAAPWYALAWVETELQLRGIVASAGLLEQTRFSRDQVMTAVSALQGRALVAHEGLLVHVDRWRELLATANRAIEDVHRDHPDQPGLSLAGLRQAIGPLDDGLIEAMTRAVVGELCRSGQFTRVQTALRRSSHVPSLPPHLRAAGGRLREALAADPLNPPSRKQLASDSTAEQALRFLISNGEAIEISRDCVISSMALEKAIERIRLELEGGPRSVSQLRQAVGSSRRIMVPLLERLDRDGVTRRDGDLRRLAR